MYAHSRVCQVGINDHSLIYAIRKFSISKRSARIIISRKFRNFNGDAFSYDLSLVPRHIIQNESNPNCAWQIWKSTFQNITDAHAPVRKRKIRINQSPSLTPELKKLMTKDLPGRNRSRSNETSAKLV